MMTDLPIPFEEPRQTAWNHFSSFKLEKDLPLPFQTINFTKRKPVFKMEHPRKQYRRRPVPPAAFSQAPPRPHHPANSNHRVNGRRPPANNRTIRRKANVLVNVDCRHSRALQCIRYVENQRLVFAKWSGADQWFGLLSLFFHLLLDLPPFLLPYPGITGTCTMV